MTDQLHPGSHPDAELLSAFVEGALPEHERLSCLSHFAECERCREIIFLAQPAKPAQALKVVPAKRMWSRPLPVFAGALAAAALLTLLILPRQGKLQPSMPPETTPTLTPSPQKMEPAPVRGVEPPTQLALKAKQHPPALVLRSENAPPPEVPLPLPADKVTMPTSPEVGPVANAAPAPPPPAAAAAGSAASAAPQLRALGRVTGFFPALSPASLAGVKGSIHDSAGSAISGATVKLHRPSGSADRLARTDALGEFNLTGLPPGKYDLQIESPGFQTEEKQVDLKPGEVASLDSTLKVGSVSETVEVAAASDAPLGVVTTIANGAHRISLDGSGRLFYLNGDGKKWKAVKPKWQGKVIQVVLISDPKAPFQLTTETGEIWLSPDGAHWHLESKEKK